MPVTCSFTLKPGTSAPPTSTCGTARKPEMMPAAAAHALLCTCKSSLQRRAHAQTRASARAARARPCWACEDMRAHFRPLIEAHARPHLDTGKATDETTLSANWAGLLLRARAWRACTERPIEGADVELVPGHALDVCARRRRAALPLAPNRVHRPAVAECAEPRVELALVKRGLRHNA
eukprot:4174179-Pleurochrysis_carterae.AAC.1